MKSKKDWQKILWALWHVFSIAFLPIGPSLIFFEVSKFMILLLAITINIACLQNWYSVLSIFALLLIIAAVRIQLQLRSEQDKQNKVNELHELRAEGYEIRIEGESQYYPGNPKVNEEVYIEKCLDWRTRLISSLEDYPTQKGFIITLGDLSDDKYNYPLVELNYHIARLRRLDGIIRELGSEK